MVFARKGICVAIAALLTVTGIFLPHNTQKADAAAAIKISGASVPGKIYKGSSVALKGTVSSKKKLTSVRVGIMTSKKKWISGKNVTVKLNDSLFNILSVDSKIKFGKLSAGTYYYRVCAKDSSGYSSNLINKKFTVSEIKTSSVTTPPASIVKGKSFSLRGTVKSHFKLKQVRVGITSSSGTWKSGFNQTRNLKTKAFSISTVDTSIKFGKLPVGSYRYVVWAKDNKGKTKTLISRSFKVVNAKTSASSTSVSSALTTTSSGTTLKYDSSLISAIGKQPVSGPCGLYAMAYCRAIMDKSFSKSGYSSYYNKLYYMYGLGSHYAYWSRAGGSPIWYSTAKSCYQRALSEVQKGKPCIINLKNNYTGNNHFVTVIGYTPGTTSSNVTLSRFIVLDPGYGTVKYLKNMNYANSSTPECVVF